MNFPADYPYSPPQFKFTPAIFHPNVYTDGRLCISILHRSGDVTSGEPDGETWSPVQTVESVLVSIVSLLSDPNINSPANLDASVTYNRFPDEFKKRVLEEVKNSKKNIPPGFVMPETGNAAYVAPKSNDSNEDVVDDDFWYESEDSGDVEEGEPSIASDDEEFDNSDDDDDDDTDSNQHQDSGAEDEEKTIKGVKVKDNKGRVKDDDEVGMFY